MHHQEGCWLLVCFILMPNRYPIEPVQIKTITGIDVGLTSLMTFSNGEKIELQSILEPRRRDWWGTDTPLKEKKGSENRNKQRIVVAKVHRRIRFQRKDFNHKLSKELVNNYDHVKFEKLQIQNMLKNHCLAKSIVDASWSQLINLTIYKAEYASKIVELVSLTEHRRPVYADILYRKSYQRGYTIVLPVAWYWIETMYLRW